MCRKQWEATEHPSDEERAAYLRQLRRLSTATRWRVLASQLEPLGNAEPITERDDGGGRKMFEYHLWVCRYLSVLE